MRMHADEVPIDAALVRRLVADQFPALAALPVTEVRSTATVNAIYRLGDGLCVRLPRVAGWSDDLDKEWRWLPTLARGLSLRVPRPVARGHADDVYPFPWAIYDWIDGAPYADDLIGDEPDAARDLARFVLELRRADPTGAPPGGRRPLAELDSATRSAIEAAGGAIDRAAATAAWERALAAPGWSGTPVWIHADLLRPNLLVGDDGRLRAVIDFGSAGVGDPAGDVIPAWAVFGPVGRHAFRAALDVGDDVWRRARGIALHQAVLIIPYYRETNPAFVALAVRTVEQVLLDADA